MITIKIKVRITEVTNCGRTDRNGNLPSCAGTNVVWKVWDAWDLWLLPGQAIGKVSHIAYSAIWLMSQDLPAHKNGRSRGKHDHLFYFEKSDGAQSTWTSSSQDQETGMVFMRPFSGSQLGLRSCFQNSVLQVQALFWVLKHQKVPRFLHELYLRKLERLSQQSSHPTWSFHFPSWKERAYRDP